jgi:hypothetical protein
VLSASYLASSLMSPPFAKGHLALTYVWIFLFNMALYAAPATLIWAVTRARWPPASACLMLFWCAFYLGSLFVFFPATDGP